jgi:hypothetical protein
MGKDNLGYLGSKSGSKNRYPIEQDDLVADNVIDGTRSGLARYGIGRQHRNALLTFKAESTEMIL